MKDLGVSGGKRGNGAPDALEETPTVAEIRPDLSGSGLGEAIAPISNNAPGAIRPDDALSELWTPDTASGQSGDLASIALERDYINNEQLESARRMERQVPGRTLAGLMIDAGADESGIQSIVAELSRIPFERILPGSASEWDRSFLRTLGTEYCRDRKAHV